MPHTILVTGATGNVGSELIKALANRGLTVRAGVHSIIKGDRLKHLNPEVQLVEIDYSKPETLHVALTGVERLCLITPFSEDQVEVAKRTIDAAKQAGVQYIIRLSAAGADAEPGIQLGRWHREIERYLEQSGIAYTILRPGSFMQNFCNYNADTICQEGKIYMPLGEGQVSYIDVRDIAATAAHILSTDTAPYQGQAYELTGPAALSTAEVAAAISEATGRPVQYVNVPEEAVRQGMAEAPAWMRDAMLELYGLSKAGYGAGTTNTVEEITGCPPRTFAQFAHDNSARFKPAQ
ncbi:SDR family oxidoreductase [Hymenobacter cellulosivorans]|uniref:SDR family oxidoreductase n=1 Tax=Hymenobacter cellulosivorans TaxID=2932249 RepID=A0ABY4F905_9BACT|nr:SDR family oxidoreductase [Hymenobacter cellulosivorans]UOQ53152.1 SDR family oxidoreductase [Hymenobacter cellulosivorans]